MPTSCRCSRSTLVSIVLLGLAGAAASPAMAQNSSDPASDTTRQQQGQFTDQQLKQFVAAQARVQTAIQHWDPKVANANAKEKDQVQEEENKALAQAVTSGGLAPQTYNAIARQATQDPALTQRIQSFMQPQ